MIGGIAPPDLAALNEGYEEFKKYIDEIPDTNVEVTCFPQALNIDELLRVYKLRYEALAHKDISVKGIGNFLCSLPHADRSLQHHWVKISTDVGMINVLVDSQRRYVSHIFLGG